MITITNNTTQLYNWASHGKALRGVVSVSGVADGATITLVEENDNGDVVVRAPLAVGDSFEFVSATRRVGVTVASAGVATVLNILVQPI